MFSSTQRRHIPILILFAINLVAGFILLPDYGISWDEPLFYDYANHIQQAYTPQAFTPGFNFDSVYGASAEDHKFYGPAYLLLAKPAVAIWQSVGLGFYQAWHWVNFLFFQVGVLILYLFLLRLMEPLPAAIGAAFMAWQPVFWGHAYINPKDIPFLVFVLASTYTGYRAVDSPVGKPTIRWMAIFGIVLGLTSAVRVIGPVAWLVVALYAMLARKWQKLGWLIAAGVLAIPMMIIAWPYLWADPINNFIQVLRHMSNNPTELAVLFNGQIFRANQMPISYIPKMLLLMLTEPTWVLIAAGEVYLWMGIRNSHRDENSTIALQTLLPFTMLFLLLISYILFTRPAVYDGFRHFLFITPILFFLPAMVFGWLSGKKTKSWLFATIAIVSLLPGIVGIFRSHPYEYNYYNQLTGGQPGAMRLYENDYWLTCYRPALLWFRKNHTGEQLYIQRELPLAKAYDIAIDLAEPGKGNGLPTGAYLLTHVRANLDQRSIFRKEPVVVSFGLPGADICSIKQVK